MRRRIGTPPRSSGRKWDTSSHGTFDGARVEVYRTSETDGDPVAWLTGESAVLDGLGGVADTAGFTVGSVAEYHFRGLGYATAGATKTVHVAWTYDPFGRKVARTVYDGAGAVASRTHYVYDGWRLIQERDGDTGTVIAEYTYGPDYVDAVLRCRRGGQDYYYHTDQQHSTVALTDGSGAVVERYGYDAFGAPTVYDASGTPVPGNASAVDNAVLYTGRTWDPALGLYDYRNRQYDPALGRFTTPDPLGPTADWNNLGNPYTYTAANPGAFVDPYGYWGIQFGDNGFNLGIGEPSLILGSDALLGANQGAMVVSDTLVAGAPYFESGCYGGADPGIRAAQCSAGIGVGSATAAVALPLLVPAVATGTIASGVSAVGAATETALLSTSMALHQAGERTVAAVQRAGARISQGAARTMQGLRPDAATRAARPAAISPGRLPAQASTIGRQGQEAGQSAGQIVAKGSQEAEEWLHRGPKDVQVYYGERTGSRVYVGVTNNLARRDYEHRPELEVRALGDFLFTRNEARAIEQVLIIRNPEFENAINSIAPSRGIYEGAVAWAEEWLAEHGM